MRHVSAAALLAWLIFFPLRPATAQTSDPLPEEFKSEAGGFLVKMPGKPQDVTQAADTASGKLEVHMYALDTSLAVFCVGYTHYKNQTLASSNRQKLLDNARDNVVKGLNGELYTEKMIMLGTNPGREIVVGIPGTNGNPATTAMLRFYLTEDRLYQVMYFAKGDIDEHRAWAYLNSFKLLGEKVH